jgi:SAM-dependent methyltransferase
MTPPMDDIAAAYEGLEADVADVAAYRAATLARHDEVAAFLAPRLGAAGGARVLEVGCGNGALLLALARRGAIDQGLGLDLARSRIAFAEAWAADEGASGLRFTAADALTAPLGDEPYAAALCLTGAFAYFDAVAPGSDAQLLERLAAALGPSGLLVLELYPHHRTRAIVEAGGGHAQLWRELDPADPWRFYLSDFTLSDGVLSHRKTLIHRHDGTVDSSRSERLRLYDDAELHALLAAAGFEPPTLHEDFTDTPYAGGPHLVVVTRRRSADR